MKKTFFGIIFITILLLFLPTTTFAYENVSIKNSQLSLEVSVEVTGSGRTFDIMTYISNNGNETVTIMILNIPGGGFVIDDGERTVYYAPHFVFPDAWYLTLDPGQSQEMYSETWKGVDDSGNKLPSGDYSVIGFVDIEGGRIYSEPVSIHLEKANSPLPPVIWTEDFSTFYISVPQDPEGDQVCYYIEWGDGTNSGWVGPYNPGELAVISHVWGEEGTYQIKVKAKDEDGISKCVVYRLILSSDFKFFGVETGYVNITYIFTIYWKGYQYLMLDWGDGNVSGWLGPFDEIGLSSYAWSFPGIYGFRIKGKDINGSQSEWSDLFEITILSLENNAPYAPKVIGPYFKPGLYKCKIMAIDPDGDYVSYQIDWADGYISEWTDWYPSGEEITRSHNYSYKAYFPIKARARDTQGAIGDWGLIKFGRSAQQSMIALFLQVLQRLLNIR